MKYTYITVLVLLVIALSLTMLQSVQNNTQKAPPPAYLGEVVLTPTLIPIYSPAPSRAPVAWYKMDETTWNGTAGEVANSIPNDPLSIFPSYSGTASGGAYTTYEEKYGRSGKFDGKDDYLDMGNFYNPGVSDTTLQAWIKATDTAAGQIILSKRNDSGHSLVLSANYVYASNTSHALMIDDGDGYAGHYAEGTTNVLDGNWHFLAGVRNATGLYIYVDGVLEGQRLESPRTIASNSNSWQIGRHGAWGKYFNGQIDDVRIYNYARTQPQIVVDSAGTSRLLDATNLGYQPVTTTIPTQLVTQIPYPTSIYPTPKTMDANGVKFHSLLIPAYEKSLVYTSELDNLSISIQYAPPPTGQPDYVTQDKLWFKATKVALGTTPNQVAEMRVISDQKRSCPEPNPNNPFCKSIDLEDWERFNNGLEKYDSGDVHGLIHTTGYEYAYLTVVFVDRTNAYEISSSVGQGAKIMSGQRQRLDEYLSKIKIVDE